MSFELRALSEAPDSYEVVVSDEDEKRYGDILESLVRAFLPERQRLHAVDATIAAFVAQVPLGPATYKAMFEISRTGTASSAASSTHSFLVWTEQVGADWIDAGGMSVLHWATDINGMGEDLAPLALRLVGAGAPLEHRDPYGWTPLARAVVCGTAFEVAALVSAGACVDVVLPADTAPSFARGRSLIDVVDDDEQKRNALVARTTAAPNVGGREDRAPADPACSPARRAWAAPSMACAGGASVP